MTARRPAPPTAAEIAAHAPHGRWRGTFDDGRVYTAREPDAAYLARADVTWQPIDNDGAVCPWPVVESVEAVSTARPGGEA